MTDGDIQKKAVRTMIGVNAAIRNIRLYPSTSTSTKNALDKAFNNINIIFESMDQVAFAESEGTLLICDRPLDEKDRRSPQVTSFQDLMTSLEIKSLTLKKGLTIEELGVLLEVMSRKPNELKEGGGLQNILKDERLPHIELDQKVYVAVDKNHEVTKKGEKRADVVKESFVPMISTLEDVLEPEYKDEVSRLLAESLMKKPDDVIVMVLTQNMRGDVGSGMLNYIVENMDQERFDKMLDRFRGVVREIESGESGVDSSEAETIKHAYESLISSEKGKSYREALKAREAEEKAKKEALRAHATAGINSILKGETTYLGDEKVLEAVPRTVSQLLSKEKIKSAYAILSTLCEGLGSDDQNACIQVAPVLAAVSGELDPETHGEFLAGLGKKASEWAAVISEPSPALDQFGSLIRTLAQDMILNGRYEEAESLLTPLSKIRRGEIEKHDEIQESIRTILRNIASDDVLEPLINEFQTNDNDKRDEAVRLLIILGDRAAENLVELLRLSKDRYERSRILQLITDIGALAMPVLTERIAEGKPWYFIRNLVLLIGKAGKESEFELILPYLKFGDFRVQREAVNAIYNIGGPQTEEILISELSDADDRLKMDIAAMLGALESEKAVPELLALFENKSRYRNEIAEKVCIALGNIGSTEAVSYLTEIIGQRKKGLMGDKPFDEKVKQAAEKALESISYAKEKPKKRPEVKTAPPEKVEQPDTATHESIQEEKQPGPADTLKDKVPEDEQPIPYDDAAKWAGLYHRLSEEETGALDSALKKARVKSGQPLLKQGRSNDKLFFIEQGEFSLTFRRGGEDILIKRLTPGDIAGSRSFFEITVCTETLLAHTDAEIKVLTSEFLETCKSDFPEMESKLKGYCFDHEKFSELIRNREDLDRREYKRLGYACKLSGLPLDESEKPESPEIPGEMINISAGGLCFSVEGQNEGASLFLNRRLNLNFALTIKKQQYPIDVTGAIVAVNKPDSNRFSVHFAFDEPLPLLIPKQK